MKISEIIIVERKLKFTAYELALMEGGESLASEIEEGWREIAAGAGAAAAMAGVGAGVAYDHAKSQQQYQPQAQVQQVKAQQPVIKAPVAKPQAQPQQITSQHVDIAKDLLSSPSAKLLTKAAKAAGIKGTELTQFLAQTAHESANYSTTKEFGDKKYFNQYDIKFNPSKAKELGNLAPGDGAKYKGRGFIQITGKYNYEQAGKALGLPLVKHPELAEKPDVAAKIAVWFWQNRVQPNVSNFQDTAQATKPINAGLKGLADRHVKFQSMKQAMAQQPKATTVAQKPAAKTQAKPVKVASKLTPHKNKKA